MKMQFYYMEIRKMEERFMYLLGYYDETDCQITLFETGIINFKKAQKIL